MLTLGRQEGAFCPHFHTTYTIIIKLKKKAFQAIEYDGSLCPFYLKSCLQHLNQLETSKCLPQLPGLCIPSLIHPGGAPEVPILSIPLRNSNGQESPSYISIV